MPSRIFFSVEFNFELKTCSSNRCVICGLRKIPSFIFAWLLENVCFKWANPSHYLSIAFTDILIKPSLMCKRGKQIFDLSSKAGCATFFWLYVLSEGSDHFFYYVVAVPRPAVQCTLTLILLTWWKWWAPNNARK